MAMVQKESQARYDNMPRSAIDTGLVDFILPVEKMAAELLKYVKHPYIGQPRKILPVEEKLENHLQKIFMLIRTGTGPRFFALQKKHDVPQDSKANGRPSD